MSFCEYREGIERVLNFYRNEGIPLEEWALQYGLEYYHKYSSPIYEVIVGDKNQQDKTKRRRMGMSPRAIAAQIFAKKLDVLSHPKGWRFPFF